MKNKVNPKFSRPRVDWRCKGAVNHGDELVLPGQCADLAQINNSHSGICRRLRVEQRGIGTNRARMLLVINGIYERGLDPQLWRPSGKKFCDAAINVALGDDVITALHQ